MKYKAKTEIIETLSIFSKLNKNEVFELSEIAIEQTLRPGEILFLEGDLPQYFYILVDGKIKAFVISSLGKEFILGFLGPGEIVGPVSIFRNKPSTGSMQALTRTKVLGFKKDEFISFIINHQKVSFELIKMLSGRVSEFSRRLGDIAGERVKQRVARILLMLSSRLGPVLPFTRQELGEMVGTTTETAIRVMCHLRSQGIISARRGKITITDENKLRRFIKEGI
jgi:CRP/FNR family transcriptional regulator